MSINLFALSGAFIAISSGVMAFGMFAIGKTRLHVLWGTFCLIVLAWGIGVFSVGSTNNSDSAFLWWRVIHVDIAFMPVVFMHFVYVFLNKKINKILLISYGGAVFFSAISAYSHLLLVHMRLVFGEFYYDSPPGPLYAFYILFFFILILWSHFLLYKRYHDKTAPALDRERILYFFLAAAVGFAGASMCFFPVYGIDIYPYTNFTVIIYPILMGYAIFRHKLFDIRAAAAQGFTLLLWIFVGIRFVLSTTQQDFFLNGGLLLAVVLFGYFFVQSINAELRSRELIEQQEKELEASNARQENLLHFLSHEVKGYFTKSQGAFSGIANGDYGVVPADVKTLAEGGLAEMRKGVETVSQILNAGDLKKGTVTFAMKPFDMRASVAAVVADLKLDADAKHLILDFSYDKSANFSVMGDEPQIAKHVTRNLLDNAIKYTPAGSVSVSLSRKENKILLAVKDSGVGITPEDKARLFTEGGRGVDSIKVNVHSTGYGLFIAKSIVEAHKGSIWADSEGAGKGSTFYVEFPAL